MKRKKKVEVPREQVVAVLARWRRARHGAVVRRMRASGIATALALFGCGADGGSPPTPSVDAGPACACEARSGDVVVCRPLPGSDPALCPP